MLPISQWPLLLLTFSHVSYSARAFQLPRSRSRSSVAAAAYGRGERVQTAANVVSGEDDASATGIRGRFARLFRSSKHRETTPVKTTKPQSANTSTTTRSRSLPVSRLEEAADIEGEAAIALDSINLAKTTTADAFEEAEEDLAEVDRTLDDIRSMLVKAEGRQEQARTSLTEARAEANAGLKAAEAAAARAIAQAERAESMIASLLAHEGGKVTWSLNASNPVTEAVAAKVGGETSNTTDNKVEQQEEVKQQQSAEDGVDIESLSYDDVGYELHEMAPPFIDENQCLVPGETVVRVEKAPDNSRRIFAGIDINGASVEDVWKVLTDYDHLQDVVPNLVVNDVLERYEVPPSVVDPDDPSLSDEEKLELISKQLRGSKLRQVGGAKVVGINFSARTTLEVREWPEGMPEFGHYEDDIYEGKSRNRRAKEGRGLALKRYRFPRPFSLSSLPYRCISMQSVEDDDGEFRMYQGVWRMQPLVGCAPPGENAMRLTYAVEISPRPYLPVALVEGRITKDLCLNLETIRDYVSG